jgi:hypothetical protein
MCWQCCRVKSVGWASEAVFLGSIYYSSHFISFDIFLGTLPLSRYFHSNRFNFNVIVLSSMSHESCVCSLCKSPSFQNKMEKWKRGLIRSVWSVPVHIYMCMCELYTHTRVDYSVRYNIPTVNYSSLHTHFARYKQPYTLRGKNGSTSLRSNTHRKGVRG